MLPDSVSAWISRPYSDLGPESKSLGPLANPSILDGLSSLLCKAKGDKILHLNPTFKILLHNK